MSFHAFAQENQSAIHFNVMFLIEVIKPGENYFSETLDDSVQFSSLKFYISEIHLMQDYRVVHALNKKKGRTIAYFDVQTVYGGVYFVKISDGKNGVAKKVIIRKE